MQKVAQYWAEEYDWRKIEGRLNALPQFITEIDGLDIHFIHVRSKHENALPLIVTHGWPGSIIEQLKIIDPLTNPTAHGGSASDAFDVVIPSLPGYGFSGICVLCLRRASSVFTKNAAVLAFEKKLYFITGIDLGIVGTLRPVRKVTTTRFSSPERIGCNPTSEDRAGSLSNSRNASRSVEFLGEADEKPFRPADVAEPIRILILDYFAYETGAALAKPAKRLVDIFNSEHDAEVA
jgi:hypothetical protein